MSAPIEGNAPAAGDEQPDAGGTRWVRLVELLARLVETGELPSASALTAEGSTVRTVFRDLARLRRLLDALGLALVWTGDPAAAEDGRYVLAEGGERGDLGLLLLATIEGWRESCALT